MDIQVPSVGESITEGKLLRWIKADGTFVNANEPLFELETDKATTDVPSPASGVLKIAVQPGTMVAIGATVGSIDEKAKAPAPAKAEVKVEAKAEAKNDGPMLSPAARQLADEGGVDPNKITGTGRDGRITKEDVQTVIADRKPDAKKPEPTPPAAVAPAPTIPLGSRNEQRQPMSGIRQRIAERLVHAQTTAAILTTFNEVDMTAVMALRTRFKETFQKKHGVGLGFMSFFVKACSEALRAFPLVNARIDGTDIVQPGYHDIGVAVSTEKGLMVPVLRNAQALSFAEIEKGIVQLGEKARTGKIAVQDLQGGTFTITNGGVFGSLMSTPILNPPQSGILGMHAIQKRAVVVDDQIVIRPMMYLALSYDHRLIDGREAVSFLMRVKDCIESPERMLLDI